MDNIGLYIIPHLWNPANFTIRSWSNSLYVMKLCAPIPKTSSILFTICLTWTVIHYASSFLVSVKYSLHFCQNSVSYVSFFCAVLQISFSIGLEECFSTFLMQQSFNRVSGVVVSPITKIFSLLLHNSNFASDMNQNVNIWHEYCLIYDLCEKVVWSSKESWRAGWEPLV